MYRSRITNQAIKAIKSKTEVQEVAPAALDHSIRVLIKISLISIKLFSFPSKLLEFRSHQRHQKTQDGIKSQIFRILTLHLTTSLQSQPLKAASEEKKSQFEICRLHVYHFLLFFVQIYIFLLQETPRAVIQRFLTF